MSDIATQLLEIRCATLEQRLELLERKSPLSADDDEAAFFEATNLPIPMPFVAEGVKGGGGETYPYGDWCAFGFEPRVETDSSTQTRRIRLTIHNITFGSPTYDKLTPAGSEAVAEYKVYPFWESLVIFLESTETDPDEDDTVQSYIAAEFTASPYPESSTGFTDWKLVEKSTQLACFSTRNENKSGLYRVPLYAIRYSVKQGACTILADYCHGLNWGLI